MEPAKPAPKKRKKKKGSMKKKAAAGEVSDRQLRTLDSNGTMLSQQGDAVSYDVEDDVDDDGEAEDNFEEEEEEFELSLTGTDEAEETAKVAAASSEAGAKQIGAIAEAAGTPEHPTAAPAKPSGESQALPGFTADFTPPEQPVQGIEVGATEHASPQPAAAAPEAAAPAPETVAAAAAPAQPPVKAARPWFPLPEKREISSEVLASLINASGAAVKRDAAPFVSKLRKHTSPHQPNATAEGGSAHGHHEASSEAGDAAETQVRCAACGTPLLLLEHRVPLVHRKVCPGSLCIHWYCTCFEESLLRGQSS